MWRARLPWPSRAELGTFATFGEARERLEAALAALGRVRVARALEPLSDYMRRFVEIRRIERLRDTKTEASRVRHHIASDPIGGIPIACLEVGDARAWLARLMLKGGGGRGERRRGKLLSWKTVRNVVVLVRVALERAVQEEVLQSNPFRFVRVPRSARASTEEGWTVLEPREQAALFEQLHEGDELGPMVKVALGLGLRRGELLSLQWQDVVLDGPSPSVLVRFGKAGAPTKGGRPRRLPLFGIALAALKAWDCQRFADNSGLSGDPVRIARASDFQVDFRKSNDGRQIQADAPHTSEAPKTRVFPAHTLKVPAPAFRRALLRAGIARNVRWHDLRHTCATSLLEGWWGRAWTVEEVRQLLGHRSSSTTERYLHARGTLVFRAAQESESVGPISRDVLKTDRASPVR